MCFWSFMSSFNLSSGYSLQLQVNLKMLHVWHLPSLRKQLTFHYASSCATIPRSEKCFWLDEANFQPIRSSMQIWVVHVNSMEFLYARFSDVISRGNHRWHSEKLAVFPGYNSFPSLKIAELVLLASHSTSCKVDQHGEGKCWTILNHE